MAHKPQKRKSPTPGFAPDGTSVKLEDYQKQLVEEGVSDVSAWIATVTETELSTEVDQFFEAIQSGALLGTLIKTIAPKDAFKFKADAPKSSFFARQNITDFCSACKNIGVPEVSLFTSNDLVERESDVRVVGCLKSLMEMFSSHKSKPAEAAEKKEKMEVEPVEQPTPSEPSHEEEKPKKQQKTTEEKIYQFTISKRNIHLHAADEKVSFPIEILKKPEERKHHVEDPVKEALDKDDDPVVKYLRKKAFISNVVLDEFQLYIQKKVERAKASDDACISLCKADNGYILFYKPEPDWFFYYPVAKTSVQEIQEEKSTDEYRVVTIESV